MHRKVPNFDMKHIFACVLPLKISVDDVWYAASVSTCILTHADEKRVPPIKVQRKQCPNCAMLLASIQRLRELAQNILQLAVILVKVHMDSSTALERRTKMIVLLHTNTIDKLSDA